MSLSASLLRHGAIVVFAAVALCCSSGGSTPTAPEPSPTPVPTPTPTPPPTPGSAQGCGVGPGTFNENCFRTSNTYLAEVDAAINRVVQNSPSLFNFEDQRGTGGYYVKDPDEYHRQVVAELRIAGFCAVKDHNEIGVKLVNDFNDQFHIMLSSQHIRRGDSSYRSTCYPAWF